MDEKCPSSSTGSTLSSILLKATASVFTKYNELVDDSQKASDSSSTTASKTNEKDDIATTKTELKVNKTCAMANPNPAPTLNLVGFEDGNLYKIRCVGDNNVVELDQNTNKLICSTEDSDKLDLQTFRARVQSNGTYRIMAKSQKSPAVVHVWDYLSHRGLLIQRKESAVDKFNQNWTSEAVPGLNSLHLIMTGPSDEAKLCLKNMGAGLQIKLIKKGDDQIGDNFLHWYLELQDMPC